MLPSLLTFNRHNQDRAVFETNVDRSATASQPKFERARRAERNRHDTALQLGLVIGVPLDVAAAVIVPADETRVERNAERRLQMFAKARELGRPAIRNVRRTGVAVDRAVVSVPGDRAIRRHGGSTRDNDFGYERDLVSQFSVGEIGVRERRFESNAGNDLFVRRHSPQRYRIHAAAPGPIAHHRLFRDRILVTR
jgi:hypothetical protein